MVLITVITINLNNRAGLEQTLRSVASQTLRTFEYIVIDGGSTDGSVQVAEDHGALISKFVSEKDQGIYDAMNKAVSLATGQFLLFLNSGDTLAGPDVLMSAEERLRTSAASVIYGRPRILNIAGEQLSDGTPEKISRDYFLFATINHQSAFIRASLFNVIGTYDTRFKYLADFEFWIRAHVHDPGSFEYIPLVISQYRLDGVSSSKKNAAALMQEKLSIISPWFSESTVAAVRDYSEQRISGYSEMFPLYRKDRSFRSLVKLLYSLRMAPWRLRRQRTTGNA